jgi:hypothetical protein
MTAWIDPKKYAGYDMIQNIVDTTRKIVSNISLSDEYKKFLDIGNYYPETHSSEEKVNWRGIILYNVHTNTENRLEKIEEKSELVHLIPEFDKITQLVKQLPGISEASINFYAPHSSIPQHVDNQWFLHHKTLDGYRRCLSVIVGVDMPSTNPELCSLTVGGETKSWASGEFFGFDGLVPHSGFNKTDNFRVTMLIETFADFWDIDQTTLAPVYDSFSEY